jgi:hypothetical protein
MKVKIRKMVFITIGIILAQYALFFVVAEFYDGLV